jgi:hypothetical protein
MSVSSQFAKTDTSRAIQLALTNHDAWFVCQDLAWALRYAPEPAVEEINELIERHAMACRDEYQRSAVRAWQVRALSERGLESQAKAVVAAALPVAVLATPQSSRADALFLLFEAAFFLGPETTLPIAAALLDYREPRPHWRVSRNLVRAMAMLSRYWPASFDRFRSKIADEKLRQRIEREAGQTSCQPRPFFW